MTAPRSAGEVRLLECLDAARDQLRELLQRWDNGLTLQNVSLVEQYVKNRLTLVVKLKYRTIERYVQFSVWSGNERGVQEEGASGMSAHSSQSRNRKNGDQVEVFIREIEIAEGDQRLTLPSLVRLYRVVDQGNTIGPGTLYRSLIAIQGGYQILFLHPDRELGFIAGTAPQGHNVVSNEVQGGAEIMHGIAHDERDAVGEGLSFEGEREASGLFVTLYSTAVKVSLKEVIQDDAQLLDVLVGPFDL